jgi:hypothetical protein
VTLTVIPLASVIEEIAVDAPVMVELAVKNAESPVAHSVPPVGVAGFDQFVPVHVSLVPSVRQ